MRNIGVGLSLWISLWGGTTACTQEADQSQQLSVKERMAKARAAKADRQAAKAAGTWVEREKARPADYQTPVDKVLKGPNGEVVHTGERGARYYINKNGNKTYLSSNQ